MTTYATAGAAVGSMFMANKSRKAQISAANRMAELSEKYGNQLIGMSKPLVDQLNAAMPKISNFLETEYRGGMDKENPFLKAQHDINLSGINREEAKQKAASGFVWAGSGRGRGEEQRIGMRALEARNKENTGYGLALLQRRDQLGQGYLAGMGQLASLGMGGMGIAQSGVNMMAQGNIQAQQNIGQANAGYWGDMMGITMWGAGQFNNQLQQAAMAGPGVPAGGQLPGAGTGQTLPNYGPGPGQFGPFAGGYQQPQQYDLYGNVKKRW